jgi:hypothetical protein
MSITFIAYSVFVTLVIFVFVIHVISQYESEYDIYRRNDMMINPDHYTDEELASKGFTRGKPTETPEEK